MQKQCIGWNICDHGVGSSDHLSISEQLQMKRLLVLTVVGLRHQRREHILILHSVSFSQDFEP